MNSREFERAKEMGRQCRRNGGKKTANPFRLGSSTDQYDAWLLGFDEADQSMARGRR